MVTLTRLYGCHLQWYENGVWCEELLWRTLPFHMHYPFPFFLEIKSKRKANYLRSLKLANTDMELFFPPSVMHRKIAATFQTAVLQYVSKAVLFDDVLDDWNWRPLVSYL